MPRYSNPLYTETSQFINGFDGLFPTSSQLMCVGSDLRARLQEEIARRHIVIGQIARGLDEMESKRFDVLPRHMDEYSGLFFTLTSALRVLAHLTRMHDAICLILQEDTSVRLAASSLSSDLPGNKPLHLVDGFIRPSQKLSKFYSILFRKNMDLTARQWGLVQPLFPTQAVTSPGRPPAACRDVLNGILWKLRTGASWDDLPQDYPSHQTCYRYFNRWLKDGRLNDALRSLNADLIAHGLDLETALQNSDIELLPVPPRFLIRFAPRLVDTWQGSTALLLVQVLLGEVRKNSSLPKKGEPVFASALDAVKIFSKESGGVRGDGKSRGRLPQAEAGEFMPVIEALKLSREEAGQS
jgi:Putative transposase of IS4/5 family (DUF4096)